MCGISVFLAIKMIEKIFNLVKSQHHRGPDRAAVIFGKNFSLGFNRLSIIDLHQRSMQPFLSKDKKNINF